MSFRVFYRCKSQMLYCVYTCKKDRLPIVFFRVIFFSLTKKGTLQILLQWSIICPGSKIDLIYFVTVLQGHILLQATNFFDLKGEKIAMRHENIFRCACPLRLNDLFVLQNNTTLLLRRE